MRIAIAQVTGALDFGDRPSGSGGAWPYGTLLGLLPPSWGPVRHRGPAAGSGPPTRLRAGSRAASGRIDRGRPVAPAGSERTMQTLDDLDSASLRDDIPDFRPGDTVKVHVKVVEGNKTRVQVFQGVVIGRAGDGVRETFTVRKVSYGVGVERTFPLHTPIIEKVEVVSRGDVRRAKLYYLRNLRGKAAKIKELRDTTPAAAE